MRTGLVAAGGIALGPAFWRDALAAPARRGRSPYGPLGPPDANGVRLPEGFRSRIVARGGAPVPGTSYTWHIFPDGAATFRMRDVGRILVSNCEAPTAVDVPERARRRSHARPRREARRLLARRPVGARELDRHQHGRHGVEG
jgi:hypothetical protein